MFLSKIKSFLKLSMVLLVTMNLVYAQSSGLPGNISNFKAEPKDQSAELSWTAATDSDGTIASYTLYYGTDSVGEENTNTYQDSVDITGDKTVYTVKNLINGVRYYFAMTATDNDGNESPYYSDEITAIPSEVSNTSLVVLSAEQIELDKIMVKMSKPVKVDSKYDAFIIENDNNGTTVPIVDTDISSQVVTLFIGGGTLTVGDTYKITATLGVSDLEGTPISSGITDSVKFTATDVFEVAVTEEDPKEKNTDQNDNTVDILTGGTEDDFWNTFLDDTIESTVDKNKENKEDNIKNDISENNSTETVDPFEENLLNNNSETIIPAIQDKIIPTEAENIKIDKAAVKTKGIVKINWKPSTASDILKQIIFIRVGLKSWDSGTDLDKIASEYEIKVMKNQNYQIRLVTVDQAGNKSYGKEFTFSTSLVSTGSNITYALLGGFILIIFMFLSKRKVA